MSSKSYQWGILFRQYALARVGWVADLLGALSVFGLIHLGVGLIDLIADKGNPDGVLLQHPLWLYTLVLGIVVVAVFVALIITAVARDLDTANTELRIKSEAEKEELRGRLERETTERSRKPDREKQRQALEATAAIFGYMVAKRKESYVVYQMPEGHEDDGSASCYSEFHFKAQRRSLGVWFRTVATTVAEQPTGSSKHVLAAPGFAVAPTVIRRADRLIERFDFTPTIEAKDGTIALSFEEEFKKSFVTRYPNPSNLDRDFVSVEIREPVAELEISVWFDGFNPADYYVETLFGSGGVQELERERIDVVETLTRHREGVRRGVTLRIAYPVMAVQYRLGWIFAKPQGPTPSGLPFLPAPRPLPINEEPAPQDQSFCAAVNAVNGGTPSTVLPANASDGKSEIEPPAAGLPVTAATEVAPAALTENRTAGPEAGGS